MEKEVVMGHQMPKKKKREKGGEGRRGRKDGEVSQQKTLRLDGNRNLQLLPASTEAGGCQGVRLLQKLPLGREPFTASTCLQGFP